MKYSRGNSVKCEIPRGHAVLVCPHCRFELGFFNPRDILVPVEPGMFQGIKPKSKDLRWAFPAAMRSPKAFDWKTLTCMFCSLPVFVDQSKGSNAGQHVTHLLTRFGPWEIGDTEIPREPTPEDAKQKLINEEWEEYEAQQKLEDRNQAAIEAAFPPEEPKETVDPEKPHVCPHCGQAFKHKSSLSRHVIHRCEKNPERTS